MTVDHYSHQLLFLNNLRIQMKGIKLIPLAEHPLEQTLQHICSIFYKNQVTMKRLKPRFEDLLSFIRPIITECYKHDCSYGFINDKNELISSYTALPFKNYLQIEPPSQISEEIRLLLAIFSKADELYKPSQQKCLFFFTGSTREDYFRKGLFSKLAQKCIENAKSKQYRTFLSDCTNPQSLNALLKYDYKVAAQFYYKDVKVEGGEDLSKIFAPDQKLARMVRFV